MENMEVGVTSITHKTRLEELYLKAINEADDSMALLYMLEWKDAVRGELIKQSNNFRKTG